MGLAEVGPETGRDRRLGVEAVGATLCAAAFWAVAGVARGLWALVVAQPTTVSADGNAVAVFVFFAIFFLFSVLILRREIMGGKAGRSS
jgi:uncharacterized membrane protein YcfT